MQDARQEGTGRVEEPEVLPPENEPRGRASSRQARRVADVFGPLAAAVLVDAVDFVSFGPVGLVAGMFVGGSLAYFFTSAYGLPVWQRLLWALAAGFYCLLPRTQVVPMATLVVALSQYWRGARRRR